MIKKVSKVIGILMLIGIAWYTITGLGYVVGLIVAGCVVIAHIVIAIRDDNKK